MRPYLRKHIFRIGVYNKSNKDIERCVKTKISAVKYKYKLLSDRPFNEN